MLSFMTVTTQQLLGSTLWSMAGQLLEAMDANDCCDDMLSFCFPSVEVYQVRGVTKIIRPHN